MKAWVNFLESTNPDPQPLLSTDNHFTDSSDLWSGQREGSKVQCSLVVMGVWS